MRKNIAIIFLFISLSGFSQNWTEEHYRYDTFSKMMTGYYNRGLYTESSNYIDSLQGNSFLSQADYFRFARIYSLNNEFGKSLEHIEIAVKKGLSKKNIEESYDMDKFAESNLYILYETNFNKWNEEYLKEFESIKQSIDTSYSNSIFRLDSIRLKLLKQYPKTNQTSLDSVNYTNKIIAQDSLNFLTLSQLIKKKGFPTRKKIGDAFFTANRLLFLEAKKMENKESEWVNIIPLINKEINNENLKPFYLEQLREQYLYETDQPLEYGIRLTVYRLLKKSPIIHYANPEEINIRRKKIGLCSVQVQAWAYAMELPEHLQNIKFK